MKIAPPTTPSGFASTDYCLRSVEEGVRFIRPKQVNTLRMLLAAKETHLLLSCRASARGGDE